MPAPIVTQITPVDGSDSLPLETKIEVTFSEEMDKESVSSRGHFVVTGSASKVVIAGPDSMNFSGDIGQDFLSSRKMSGPTDGAITTEDLRTFTFTPSAPLEPNATYKVLISTGVRARTVGDVVSNLDPATTGAARIRGIYSGAQNTELTVEIDSGGALGEATFTASLTDGTVIGSGAIDRSMELDLGLRLEFNAGSYTLGDSYVVELFASDSLEAIYTAEFTTGDPTYIKVPEVEESFELIEHVVSGEARASNILVGADAPLMIVSMEPSEEVIGLGLNTRSIVLTFNKDIDPDSLTDESVTLLMESLPMDQESQVSVPLDVAPTVSGNKLTIRFN